MRLPVYRVSNFRAGFSSWIFKFDFVLDFRLGFLSMHFSSSGAAVPIYQPHYHLV